MIAVDTSVAVPLLVETHDAHDAVFAWGRTRDLTLSGHALAETYSVLTRLPGGMSLTPEDTVLALKRRFKPPLLLSDEIASRIPSVMAERGIAGGAVYDGLVALAAAEHDLELATRDERARLTYATFGVRVTLVV